MNAEYFGLGRRRALASCGSHRDFPWGGNAASLQCRASGAGVFGKAVSTQLLELHPCCRANSLQVQAESGYSAKSCLNCAQQVDRWDEAVVVAGWMCSALAQEHFLGLRDLDWSPEGEEIWGGNLCGLLADLGMTVGEENAAAPQVTQDAGGTRVLTPLPCTRLGEGDRVVTAEIWCLFLFPIVQVSGEAWPRLSATRLAGFCLNHLPPSRRACALGMGRLRVAPHAVSVRLCLGSRVSCTSIFSAWAVQRALRCCGSTCPASPEPAVSQGNLSYPF